MSRFSLNLLFFPFSQITTPIAAVAAAQF